MKLILGDLVHHENMTHNFNSFAHFNKENEISQSV
jgi:hypothetical protein